MSSWQKKKGGGSAPAVRPQLQSNIRGLAWAQWSLDWNGPTYGATQAVFADRSGNGRHLNSKTEPTGYGASNRGGTTTGVAPRSLNNTNPASGQLVKAVGDLLQVPPFTITAVVCQAAVLSHDFACVTADDFGNNISAFFIPLSGAGGAPNLLASVHSEPGPTVVNLSSLPVPPGVWTFLAMRINADLTVDLFADAGKQSFPALGSQATVATNLRLMSTGAGVPASQLEGSMADVNVYRVSLTDEELLQLFQESTGVR